MHHRILLNRLPVLFLPANGGTGAGGGRLRFLVFFFLQQNATRRADCRSYPTESADLNATPKNAADDLADVERVLAGDVRAFEGIVRRWQGSLLNMAWRYCRDRERAEEMAQEAFLRAWRGLGQWRRDGSFSTWLFALAANVFRSELKRFPTVTVPLEAAPEPSGAASQLNALQERSLHDVLRRAVRALPLRYREPVILFYFHEMDVAQAAATLRMPEGTLKARLSRARALLRRRFPHLEAEQAAMAFCRKTEKEA
jgi:RNA polymerase sigma-70 factor (ECF subfamily)